MYDVIIYIRECVFTNTQILKYIHISVKLFNYLLSPLSTIMIRLNVLRQPLESLRVTGLHNNRAHEQFNWSLALNSSVSSSIHQA